MRDSLRNFIQMINLNTSSHKKPSKKTSTSVRLIRIIFFISCCKEKQVMIKQMNENLNKTIIDYEISI